MSLTINLKVGVFAIVPTGRTTDALFYELAKPYGLDDRGALTGSLLQQWRCHMSMPILSGDSGINLETKRPPNWTWGLNDAFRTGDKSYIGNWSSGG